MKRHDFHFGKNTCGICLDQINRVRVIRWSWDVICEAGQEEVCGRQAFHKRCWEDFVSTMREGAPKLSGSVDFEPCPHVYP